MVLALRRVVGVLLEDLDLLLMGFGGEFLGFICVVEEIVSQEAMDEYPKEEDEEDELGT